MSKAFWRKSSAGFLLSTFIVSVFAASLSIRPAGATDTINETELSDCDTTEHEKFSDLNYSPKWAKRKDWFATPVLFATDRNSEKRGACSCFSEQQRADREESALCYGQKVVLGPRLSVLADPKYDSFFQSLGWQVEEKYFRNKQETSTKLRNLKFSEAEFFSELTSRKKLFEQAIAKLPPDRPEERHNDLVIFVHGCCRSFDLHMEHTAYLKSWLCREVISYDWAAPHVSVDVTKYLGNEVNVQRTEDRFLRFLEKIESIYSPEKTILVAHSMGNRLIEEALIRRAIQKKPQFKEVIFGCADTDFESFKNHSKLISDSSSQVTIYTSMHDKLLALSATAHAKQHRLGRMSTAECTDLLLSCARSNLRIFDVTELDINHDLPIWLIANLYQQNNPRTGGKFTVKMPFENLFVFENDKGFRPQVAVANEELSAVEPDLIEIYQHQLTNVWTNQARFDEPISLSITVNAQGVPVILGGTANAANGRALNYASRLIVESSPLPPPASALTTPIKITFFPTHWKANLSGDNATSKYFPYHAIQRLGDPPKYHTSPVFRVIEDPYFEPRRSFVSPFENTATHYNPFADAAAVQKPVSNPYQKSIPIQKPLNYSGSPLNYEGK